MNRMLTSKIRRLFSPLYLKNSHELAEAFLTLLLLNIIFNNNIYFIYIDIYTRQVRARKKATDVHGIPDDIDLQLVIKAWKKLFHCVCAIKDDPKTKEKFITLNGDHRQNVYEFLIKEGIGTKENIKMHGADV